jgi:hypothetical protein
VIVEKLPSDFATGACGVIEQECDTPLLTVRLQMGVWAKGVSQCGSYALMPRSE